MSLIPQIIRMQVESKCTRELCLSSLLAVFRRLMWIYSIWFYFVSKIYPWMSRPNNQSTGKKESWNTSIVFKLYFFHLSSKCKKIYSFLPEIINIQYFFMNKMHNLQKWQLSAPPPTQYCLTVCIQLIYHRVITVISMSYSHYKCQSYFSIQYYSFY